MFVGLDTLVMFSSLIHLVTHKAVIIPINKSKHTLLMQCQNIYYNCRSPNPLTYISFLCTDKIIFNHILKDTEELEAKRQTYVLSDNRDDVFLFYKKYNWE